MNKLCSVCRRNTDSETSSILVMGGFGNPKYLCEECERDFDKVTGARNYESIKAAMDKVGENLSKNNVEDQTVLDAIEEIFVEARERAEKIKNGTYDFSEEELETVDEEDEIPEDLRESEEDKQLDQKEAKVNKKIDTILNWAFVVIFVLAIGFFVAKLLMK